MEFKDPHFEAVSVKRPDSKESDNRPELLSEISQDPPVVESFLDPARAAEVWPENIATNEIFLDQLKKRAELRERFDDVVNRLPRPDVSLEDAIGQGLITEEQAAKLYQSLGDLLESDEYKRVVLYLPFEFLPNNTWRPSGEALWQSSDRFRQKYMKAWRGLLDMYDPRANFVDGDILEEQNRTSDVPRVVKAAHLIPKLVEKGFLKTGDAIALLEESNDEILKHSIADALPVLADLGLLATEDIARMENSTDRLVSSMARIVAAGMKSRQEKTEARPELINQSSIQQDLREEFARIDSEDYGDITERRKKWLVQKKKQEAIEVSGKNISEAIISDNLSSDVLAGFLSPEANLVSQQALVEGIRGAVESAAQTDQRKAQTLYTRFKEILLALWNNDDSATRGMLSKTFRRLRQGGIVDENQLTELNISTPKLAGPFSENLKMMETEMKEINGMVALIESNPELSRLIYPVVLVQGSRLNGYGSELSDIDPSVFVKPGTSLDSRTKLQGMLREIFSHEKIKGDEIVEFWLEEKGERLEIQNFPEADPSFGGNYLASNLFGAAWVGDTETMRELRKKLLAPYLYDTDKMLYGRNLRNLCLEKMEQGLLQYRLMHKGYEQYFPPYGGIQTRHADEIDGESMFWDSGYRQLASKLFVSYVFLPKIPRP